MACSFFRPSLEGDLDWTLFQRSEGISNAVYIRAVSYASMRPG